MSPGSSPKGSHVTVVCVTDSGCLDPKFVIMKTWFMMLYPIYKYVIDTLTDK